jgi:uncharacterized damage-inducible protein DinB
MPINLALDDLMEYTAWERQKWHAWLRQHGDEVLKIGAGAHGDGRFRTVGDLMRHMFSAEKRYIDRLSGRELTDTASIPNDNIEAIFRFGQQSRKELKEFVETFPGQELDVPQDHKMQNSVLTVTPRKIVVHILLHEIRHWAQIATLLRLNDLVDDFHDFLFSPVMGGGIRRDQVKG